MATIKKAPSIRFEGFEEEWVENKLKDLAELLTGNPFESKKFVKKGILLVRGMNVKRGYLDISEDLSEYWPTSKGLEHYLLAENDIVIQMDGALIGKSYAKISLENLPALLVQRVTRIRSSKANYEFIYQKINKNFLSHIFKIKTETAVPHLSLNDIRNFEIQLPSQEQQKKIGIFFKTLDDWILLQEQKLEKVINLKKAMLQRMFPVTSAAIPEIRFKGFTDNWEKKKLNDCLETSTQKNNEMKFSKNDVLSVSGEVGIVNQIAFQGRSFAGMSVRNYGVVKHGNIVYTKSPLKANPYGIIKTNRGKDGIVSTLYAIYSAKENIDSNFVEYYFGLDKRLNNYLKPLVSKGAKNDMKVSDDNALKGTVIFPKEKIEQTKIADYFQSLDQLISLSQQKIEQLKHLKQALLQKMFI